MTDLMIALNDLDFFHPHEGGTRDICSVANQQTYTHAPWWTCENIQLTDGGSIVTNAVVGTTYVIQVGVEGVFGQVSGEPAIVENVQAWVCFPNTVAGQASATLIVPSMQNNQFAQYSNANNQPLLFFSGTYQDPTDFQWVNLSPWTPSQLDFMEEGAGHCCIIANVSGFADIEDISDPSGSGLPAGKPITNQSQLPDFNICNNQYQGQRNIVIVPAKFGGIRRIGFAFLSGAPETKDRSRATISLSAINQGTEVDPVLLKALSGTTLGGLPLKPASIPPRSMRLARHGWRPHNWLETIVCEAEEIVEELLGLDKLPFGGGHQLHLSLPPKGLQPLRMEIELDPTDPPGTVHSIEITQTDADGARGGIRVGVIVSP